MARKSSVTAPPQGGRITESSPIPQTPTPSAPPRPLRRIKFPIINALGDLYQTITGIFDADGGVHGSNTDTTSFDGNGQDTTDNAYSGAKTHNFYDGAGRLVKTFTTDNSGDILQETKSTYDQNGNVTETVTLQVPEGDVIAYSGISDPQSYDIPLTGGVTVSATVNWYDAANRLIETANFGNLANPGSGNPYSLGTTGSNKDQVVASGSSVADGSPIERTSDNAQYVQITTTTYNDADNQVLATDNAGEVTCTQYRPDGQVQYVITNYGGATNESEETDYEYAASGQMIAQIVQDPGVGPEATYYVYNDPLNPNQATDVIYPDSIDAPPSYIGGTGAATITDTDHVHYTFDQFGRTLTATDQRGVTHTYTYDAAGDMICDTVSGMTSPVMQIKYAYNDQHQLLSVTSYAVAQDPTTPPNPAIATYAITYDYSAEGNTTDQVDATTQDHGTYDGAQVSGTVSYSWTDGTGLEGVQLYTMTMPTNNRTITYNYLTSDTGGETGGGADLLGSITDGMAGTLVSYTYLGASQVVQETFGEVSNGSSHMAENLNNLNLFGQLNSVSYTLGSTTLDGYSYTYDADNNVVSRGNLTASGYNLDQAYQYDGLNRLTQTNYGTLTDGTITDANATSYQGYTMDAAGNFTSIDDNGTTQDRTADAANEIATINGTAVSYDADGDLTEDAAGNTYSYDAWNRLISVTNSSSVVLASYAYDGLGRCITETAGGDRYDFYYDESNQVVETDKDGKVYQQFVWDPRAADTPLELTDYTGSAAGSYFYMQDANHNVTGLVSTSGAVVERYAYDAYGNATIYSGNSWSSIIADSSVGNEERFQGMEFDPATGLYRTPNRNYSPNSQTWITRDPAGYGGSPGDLYGFVGDSPINITDRTGMAPPSSQTQPAASQPSLATRPDTQTKRQLVAAVFAESTAGTDASEDEKLAIIATIYFYCNRCRKPLYPLPLQRYKIPIGSGSIVGSS